MNAGELTQARREADLARERLIATAGELQYRLKPGTIASNAWAGVKDKGGEIAEDAVEAVKSRPMPVAAALTAFTLFMVREPLKSAVSRLFSASGDDDIVSTRLDGGNINYDITAPLGERKKDEGVTA